MSSTATTDGGLYHGQPKLVPGVVVPQNRFTLDRQTVLILGKMLAAGSAASVAEMVTIPIDTSKVRLQVQGQGERTALAVAKAVKPKYKGMLQTMMKVAREEGLPTLYKGLTAGVHRQLCFCGVRIGLYDTVRQMYGDNGVGRPKVFTKIAASITTASLAVVLFQPTEVVKIRMQAAGVNSPYTGAFNAYATIARNEGFKGMWRGVSPNVMRLSVVNCTEIVVYDVIKSMLLFNNLMVDGVPLHFTSAVSAGFVTTVIASPVDVVKTRFMNSKVGSYRNPIHCALTMLRENGPTAFYKGFVPSFTRLGLWNITFFLSYEQIKRLGNVDK